MPALPNRRQELFCLKVAQGIPASRAYVEAGYKPHESNPYRMSGYERVKQRLIELAGTEEADALSQKDRLIQELATMAFAALGDENVKTSEKRQCIMDIAKLQGLLIDRKEIRRVDEFESMSEDELIGYIDVTYHEVRSLEGGENDEGGEEEAFEGKDGAEL